MIYFSVKKFHLKTGRKSSLHGMVLYLYNRAFTRNEILRFVNSNLHFRRCINDIFLKWTLYRHLCEFRHNKVYYIFKCFNFGTLDSRFQKNLE